MNETIRKFGFPDSLVHEYDHWVVLLRPQQVTLGSLVLACKEPVQQFNAVSEQGFAELKTVISDIERALKSLVAFEKMNYLMLMMVDPDVHFHVIPRYPEPADWQGSTFTDHGWPGPPALGQITETDAATNAALVNRLQAAWAE